MNQSKRIEQLEARVAELERTVAELMPRLPPVAPAVQIQKEPRRCQGVTKAGSQCKRNAKKDQPHDLCWQHMSQVADLQLSERQLNNID